VIFELIVPSDHVRLHGGTPVSANAEDDDHSTGDRVGKRGHRHGRFNVCRETEAGFPAEPVQTNGDAVMTGMFGIVQVVAPVNLIFDGRAIP
jgi:hypothetical protein